MKNFNIRLIKVCFFLFLFLFFFSHFIISFCFLFDVFSLFGCYAKYPAFQFDERFSRCSNFCFTFILVAAIFFNLYLSHVAKNSSCVEKVSYFSMMIEYTALILGSKNEQFPKCREGIVS